MKQTYLRRRGSDSLLLVFSGWTGEPALFPLPEAKDDACPDILLLYDYADPAPLELNPDACRHLQVGAWSLGVAMAEACCRDLGLVPESALAFNGTPWPVDDTFGIPEAVFDGTLARFSDANFAKFCRRMCGSRENLATWEVLPRRRDLESLHRELAFLREFFRRRPELAPESRPAAGFRWTAAVIGERDLIFPVQAQLRAWSSLPGTRQLRCDAAHYDAGLLRQLLDPASMLWNPGQRNERQDGER